MISLPSCTIDGTKLGKQKGGLKLVTFGIRAQLADPGAPAPAPAARKKPAGTHG